MGPLRLKKEPKFLYSTEVPISITPFEFTCTSLVQKLTHRFLYLQPHQVQVPGNPIYQKYNIGCANLQLQWGAKAVIQCIIYLARNVGLWPPIQPSIICPACSRQADLLFLYFFLCLYTELGWRWVLEQASLTWFLPAISTTEPYHTRRGM